MAATFADLVYSAILDLEWADEEAIRGLHKEAGQAGDLAQVSLCEAALDGDDEARERCLVVVGMAAGMADDD